MTSVSALLAAYVAEREDVVISPGNVRAHAACLGTVMGDPAAGGRRALSAAVRAEKRVPLRPLRVRTRLGINVL